ncbi:hypothetical protein GCM10010104_16110 [Streptomyces indiaensis]|uniref:Uncharacterized protein n=1 Tax=Streptomyces indiaensis TaxID=284033 RepID=A0ABP5Q3H2_9ACTN
MAGDAADRLDDLADREAVAVAEGDSQAGGVGSQEGALRAWVAGAPRGQRADPVGRSDGQRVIGRGEVGGGAGGGAVVALQAGAERAQGWYWRRAPVPWLLYSCGHGHGWGAFADLCGQTDELGPGNLGA